MYVTSMKKTKDERRYIRKIYNIYQKAFKRIVKYSREICCSF